MPDTRRPWSEDGYRQAQKPGRDASRL